MKRHVARSTSLSRAGWLAGLVAAVGLGYVCGHFGVTRNWFPTPQIAAALNGSSGNARGGVEVDKLEKSAIYRETAAVYDRYGQPAELVIVSDSMLGGLPWNELVPDRAIAERTIGGDLAMWLPARLPAVVATGADDAIVMIGLNDAVAGRSAQAIHADILRSVATLTQAGMAVHVITPLPCTKANRTCGDASAVLTQVAQKLASRSGGARVIDLWPAMAPDGYLLENYSVDGVHFNADGVAIMLAAVRADGI